MHKALATSEIIFRGIEEDELLLKPFSPLRRWFSALAA
jgi:hypothetical protein